MKIIIPMTGYGSRFVAAGYRELKPFIQVQGKPILQWIIEGIYPGEKDFLFICRQEHAQADPDFIPRIQRLAPGAEVCTISDWVKKGPVYDILRAEKYIDDEDACIINYCDFYMTWDWARFKEEVRACGCDGSIPCYTGFHPHLLPPNNLYASCLTDDDGNLLEIREKYSFEQDKTKAKHSPGVYYFRTGALLKQYCRKLVENGPALNGEYYASLPYQYMLQDGLKVWAPANVGQFCQWGTPEDMEDYLFWTQAIRRYVK